MRIDKFLNVANITKRRAIAEDMLKSEVIFVNDIVVKKAKCVKIGDIIKIQYLKYEEKYQILDIPKTKSIPKSSQSKYICQIK